jgi:hypothetical protein
MLATGRRSLEGFEAMHARRHGHIGLSDLLPGQAPAPAGLHEQVRTVVTVMHTLGARLTKATRVA